MIVSGNECKSQYGSGAPTEIAIDTYESKIRLLEGELLIMREEKETQELEIRHLKLMNNTMNNSSS